VHDTFDPVALARRQAVIGAALARGGAGLRSASLVIGLAAIGLGLVLLRVDPHPLTGVIGWLSLAQALFIGLGQFFGLRTAVDADLFADLARDPDLATFDGAMAGLGLLPVAKQGRSMADRVAGLRRLLRLQGSGVTAQLLLLAALVAPGGLL
jgi:hypothetical protein